MKKLSDLFPGLLGTSPLTSIFGYIVSILVAVQPIIQSGSFDLKKDWLNLLFAVFVALGFRNAKDTNGVTADEGKAMKNVLIIPPAPAPKVDPVSEIQTRPLSTVIPVSTATPIVEEKKN